MKEKVLLLGASGSMGFAAFQELWNRKNERGERKYDIILLLRPSQKNKDLFKPYERECGIKSFPGKGICEDPAKTFKIVWGDATYYEDMVESVRGSDWVLCPMALISPEADRNPEQARAVNTTAIEYLLKAIEAQPNGAEHIRLVYTGTAAATGDRLPPIQWGRIGDPMKPPVFDFYATTKIRGEYAVLESNLKHWVSLRPAFILIPNIMNLKDPIMFSQPINSYMENITMRDAGRGLINCLNVPDDSDFWCRVYNMSGGPSCRIIFLEFLKMAYDMLGLDYRNVCERRWFGLRNFHMQFFLDSGDLNKYVHNWGDSMDTYKEMMRAAMPTSLKLVSKFCKVLPPFRKLVEKVVYNQMKKLARGPSGTLGWINGRNDRRVTAFYGSYEKYEKIPDWDVDMPEMRYDAPFVKLDHGYDEIKVKLDLNDLKSAARFRGGDCTSNSWNRDLTKPVRWKCAFGHEFTAKPYTILKAGHWCLQCLPPPWNDDAIAKANPFFAQAWCPHHEKSENNFYPEDCYKDIEGLKDIEKPGRRK